MGCGARRGVALVWVVTGEARRWGVWNVTARDVTTRRARHVGHDGQGMMDALAPLPRVVFRPWNHRHADLYPQPALPKRDTGHMHIIAMDLELLARSHRHNTVLAYNVLAHWWVGHNAQLEQSTQGMQRPEPLLGGAVPSPVGQGSAPHSSTTAMCCKTVLETENAHDMNGCTYWNFSTCMMLALNPSTRS